MKTFLETVGIDVSKSTIDVTLHCGNAHSKFDNNEKGFKSMIKWTKKNTTMKLNQVLFCFEHTGLYSVSLSCFFTEKGMSFALVPAIEIKRSMGLVRGKDDKVDSKRIAEYAYLRKDTLKPTEIPSKNLSELSRLINLRERLVVERAGHKGTSRELKQTIGQTTAKEIINVHEKMIEHLTTEIKKLEKTISKVIEADPEISKVFNLTTSVKGVGSVVACHIIVATNCFQSFDDPRKFSCYCGIAPFPYSSGSSIRGASRISHYANKKLKALIDRSALSAIVHDKELREYYERKIGQGKKPRVVINAVRNKIIHRIFAVVKREEPFVEKFINVA